MTHHTHSWIREKTLNEVICNCFITHLQQIDGQNTLVFNWHPLRCLLFFISFFVILSLQNKSHFELSVWIRFKKLYTETDAKTLLSNVCSKWMCCYWQLQLSQLKPSTHCPDFRAESHQMLCLFQLIIYYWRRNQMIQFSSVKLACDTFFSNWKLQIRVLGFSWPNGCGVWLRIWGLWIQTSARPANLWPRIDTKIQRKK